MAQQKGYMFCPRYFLSSSFNATVSLETNYLRMYWTDRHRIFRYRVHIWVDIRDRSRDVAMVTDFWRESAKTGMLYVHSVHWHSTTDGKIAIAMRALTPPKSPTPTSDKNLTNFGPVTHVLQVCARRASRWALSRIYSYSARRKSSVEYWIHFTARFGSVHAFSYNSAESEPIWMKSGALWVHCWWLALAAFRRNPRSSDIWTVRRFFSLFVHWFPVCQISQNLNTTRWSVSQWKFSEQNFGRFIVKSRFSKKNAIISQKFVTSYDCRPP